METKNTMREPTSLTTRFNRDNFNSSKVQLALASHVDGHKPIPPDEAIRLLSESCHRIYILELQLYNLQLAIKSLPVTF